jgi:hypothetical protein
VSAYLRKFVRLLAVPAAAGVILGGFDSLPVLATNLLAASIDTASGYRAATALPPGLPDRQLQLYPQTEGTSVVQM